MYEDGTFVTVDLDYLVDAHICVYEDVSSYGRYLCFNHVINRHEDAFELARKLTHPAPSAQRLVITVTSTDHDYNLKVYYWNIKFDQ